MALIIFFFQEDCFIEKRQFLFYFIEINNFCLLPFYSRSKDSQKDSCFFEFFIKHFFQSRKLFHQSKINFFLFFKFHERSRTRIKEIFYFKGLMTLTFVTLIIFFSQEGNFIGKLFFFIQINKFFL